MRWDGRDRRNRRRYGVKDAVVRYKTASPLALLAAPSPRLPVLNISESGLEFLAGRDLDEGRTLSLTLAAPELREDLRLRGRVVRVSRMEDQRAWRAAVAFKSASGATHTRLRRLLDNAVLDSVEVSTRVCLKEIDGI